ncbi:quinon protein alcohol dehydrogenase-like superfamily [Trichoderma sp. SZMC 28015]
MSLQSKVDEILARLGDIDTASSTIDVETVELVVSFIKNDLLPWLDDFAYKGRHANAAFFMKELMKKLETVLLGQKQARNENGEPLKTQHFKQLKGEVLEQLGENEQSHIASLIRDGIQLLRLHTSENDLASKHPSSVIFYPEESALKQEWMAENKAWLVTPPKMTHNWSNIPSTLNTGRRLYLNSIAISPCGGIFATRSRNLEIRLWDAETGAELTPTPELLKEEAFHIAFSPSGQLASASVDHTLRIWDVNTGKTLNAWPVEGQSIIALRFSPNSEGSEELVLATSDALLLWKFSDFGKPKCTYTEEIIEKGSIKGCYICAVDFSQQGTWIASGSTWGDIKIWDARHGNVLHKTIQGHKERINSVAFSQDEKRLVSGSSDCTVKIWSVETGANLKLFDCTGPISAVAFSPDGSFIAAGFNKHVRVWESESGAQRYVMNGHEEIVYSMAFSPQGRLVSASHDANIQLWDIEGSASNDTNALSESPSCRLVNFMTMSPDGKYLASASGYYIYLWDGMTGMPMDIHELFQERQVSSISFSPDGKYLVASSTGGIVKVWHVAKGSIYRIFEGHSDDCTSATFSPDGNYIASSSCDKTVRIRSLLPGAERGDAIILKGHKGKVITVAFSPDGRSLVSGDDRSSVIIWDRESLQQKHRLTGHGYIAKVVFSQDSSRIVSRSKDNASGPKSNTVCVWDATTGNIIHGPQTISWPGWPHYNQRMGFSLEMSEYFLYLAECGIDPSALGLSPTVVEEGRKGARYRVAQDGYWITCNGKNIISIPKMYRPEASWVQGNTVALGTKWGKVLLFRFSAEVSPPN